MVVKKVIIKGALYPKTLPERVVIRSPETVTEFGGFVALQQCRSAVTEATAQAAISQAQATLAEAEKLAAQSAKASAEAARDAAVVAKLAAQNAILSITKESIGLGSVTNNAQVKRTEMGVASGVATLDALGQVPSTQLGNVLSAGSDLYLANNFNCLSY